MACQQSLGNRLGVIRIATAVEAAEHHFLFIYAAETTAKPAKEQLELFEKAQSKRQIIADLYKKLKALLADKQQAYEKLAQELKTRQGKLQEAQAVYDKAAAQRQAGDIFHHLCFLVNICSFLPSS